MIEAPGSKETRLWEAERLFPWTKYRLTCGQMGKRFLTPVTEILFTSGKLTWYISTVANGNLEVPRVGWRMLKESLKEFLYICIYIYIFSILFIYGFKPLFSVNSLEINPLTSTKLEDHLQMHSFLGSVPCQMIIGRQANHLFSSFLPQYTFITIMCPPYLNYIYTYISICIHIATPK